MDRSEFERLCHANGVVITLYSGLFRVRPHKQYTHELVFGDAESMELFIGEVEPSSQTFFYFPLDHEAPTRLPQPDDTDCGAG